MRISDWSSDVCSSDLRAILTLHGSRCRPSIGLQTSSVRSGRSTHRLTCASWSTLGTTYSAGRAMAARKLTYRQIADLLLDLECGTTGRSEEHTSELQSLMRISYAVFCLKKQNHK